MITLGVDLSVVWEVSQRDLPELKQKIETPLKKLDENP